MSRKAIKESKFPKFNLSISQIKNNLSAVEIKPEKKTNDYGGQHVDLKLNDGKSTNRRVSLELEQQYSRFGVSEFQDKKDPTKSTTSIQLPLNENPELKEMAVGFDRHMIEALYQHRVQLWDDESMDKRFIEKIYKGMQRKPKKPQNLQDYGMNYKINIGPSCKYFRTLTENSNQFVPCQLSELKNKEGTYSIIVSLPRVFIKDTECGLVSYASHIVFHGDAEASDEIFSSLKRKVIENNPPNSEDLGSPNPKDAEPLSEDLTNLDVPDPPTKKQKLQDLDSNEYE